MRLSETMEQRKMGRMPELFTLTLDSAACEYTVQVIKRCQKKQE